MNKKDIPVLVLIIGISALFSYLIVSQFISSPKDRQQTVETTQAISAQFTVPTDGKNFNTNAINPTQKIEIGPNSNDQPFSAPQ